MSRIHEDLRYVENNNDAQDNLILHAKAACLLISEIGEAFGFDSTKCVVLRNLVEAIELVEVRK